MPIEKILGVIPDLEQSQGRGGWKPAAASILTTDTFAKGATSQALIGDTQVSINGIAKGSGMIRPDMATMLSYVATDADIETDELNSLLNQAVAASFNSITVDGDTSTNDACVLIATAASGQQVTSSNTEFVEALSQIFQQLAQAIIRDAEGATKFVEIEVSQAARLDDAREVAYCIAHSPLVKTALFASDPNWGRILAAIGRANIEQLDIDKVDLFLGDTCLLTGGLPDLEYTEAKGQTAMDGEEICIRVALNNGDRSATIWTSDLSYEYVKINAEYRS